MPHVAERVPDLLARLAGAAHLDGDALGIDDEATFRDTTIRDLAWTAAFAGDEATVGAA
jgi:cytochrome P450